MKLMQYSKTDQQTQDSQSVFVFNSHFQDVEPEDELEEPTAIKEKRSKSYPQNVVCFQLVMDCEYHRLGCTVKTELKMY